MIGQALTFSAPDRLFCTHFIVISKRRAAIVSEIKFRKKTASFSAALSRYEAVMIARELLARLRLSEHQQGANPMKPYQLTAAQAVEQLEKLTSQEPESAHLEADEILCALLLALGHEPVVIAWEKVKKWYA